MDFLQNNGIIEGGMRLLTGLVILIVAWFVAVLLRRFIRGLLRKTNIDNRISDAIGGGANFPVENTIATIVFYLVMFFGVIAAFDAWDLPAVTGPLNSMLDSVMTFLPTLGGALILGAVAFLVATVVKMLIERGSDALNIDKRIKQLDAEADVAPSIGSSLANAAFWLIIFLFLPSIISKLGMDSLVQPLNDMLGSFLGFVPNLISAALIGLVGWFLARIVRQVVTSLMNAADVDRFGRNAGLNLSITNLVGTLVYTVILLLTIVQALNQLGIDSISAPATNMIDSLFGAVPNLVGAALVLGITFVVGRLVSGLVASLLQSVGFDSVPSRLGLKLNDERSASQYAGYIVLVIMMLLAAVSATNMLGFAALTEIVQSFVGFGGQILLGIIVLGLGVFLANFAAEFMRDAGFSSFSVSLVRAAILVLVGAMALTRMGIGDEIVQLAFGIGLGAIGIAAALAFGLGSRDIAGREVEKFVASSRSEIES